MSREKVTTSSLCDLVIQVFMDAVEGIENFGASIYSASLRALRSNALAGNVHRCKMALSDILGVIRYTAEMPIKAALWIRSTS